jgi:DnaJ-domain-containing protein 1
MGGYVGSADAAQGYAETAEFARGEAGWGFAEEVRRRMGEGFEPDAQFMEESWTLGVGAAAESWRARRGGAVRERGDQEARERRNREERGREFREMDSVGARAFAQASEWYAAMRRAGSGALAGRGGQTGGDAGWLQRCAEDPFGGWRAREAVAEEVEGGAGEGMAGGMSLGRAMRLLGLTAASTREQVRAAYRRMAGEWHPDRVAGRAEGVRRAATEQMAEINEAYRVLRAAVG